MAIPTVTLLDTAILAADPAGVAITSGSINVTGGVTHPLIAFVRNRNTTVGNRFASVVLDTAGTPQAFSLAGALAIADNQTGGTRTREIEIWVLASPSAVSGKLVIATASGDVQSGSMTVYEVSANFDSFGPTFGSNTGTGSATVGLLTTRPDSLVLGGCFYNNQDGTHAARPFTPSAGSELVDSQSGASANDHGLSDLSISAAAIGTATLTTAPTNSSNWAMVSIEIRSALHKTIHPGLGGNMRDMRGGLNG